MGDSDGEPMNRTSRHSARSTMSAVFAHHGFKSSGNFDETEAQSSADARNAGHQASVRCISVSRNRQIGRQTGCIGGIDNMVGFISVVFEVLAVADPDSFRTWTRSSGSPATRLTISSVSVCEWLCIKEDRIANKLPIAKSLKS